MRPDDNKTRFELVPYFHGRILDVSEGRSRAYPHFISHLDLLIDDPSRLGAVAGQSLDGVFSSFLLHLMNKEKCADAVKEWSRVVKTGGSIMFHLPLKSDSAKWQVGTDAVIEIMESLQRGWDMCQSWEHPDEDSALWVFRVQQGRSHTYSCREPVSQKRCGIVRLGAYGDMVQASSILPWLKEQGYHVTLYCSDSGYEVVRHDPNVDRFILQGRDEVPPAALGDFWNYERTKYDKWVNLSESVEGTLLSTPDSLRFYWPHSLREQLCDRNYLEFTHEIAEVPPPYRPAFYSTPDERAWARAQAGKMGRKNVLWSLSGSAVHKTWPHMDAVLASIMIAYKDVDVVLVGDEACQILEAGWDDEARVHKRSGKWSIRQSMAFAEVADLIVGTETGLLNAAGLMDTPKIVTLSHSSENMLAKHWKHVTVLTQGYGGCPKFPCRQMHKDWSTCMKHDDGGSLYNGSALCQHAIGADVMWQAVRRVLGDPQRMVA